MSEFRAIGREGSPTSRGECSTAVGGLPREGEAPGCASEPNPALTSARTEIAARVMPPEPSHDVQILAPHSCSRPAGRALCDRAANVASPVRTLYAHPNKGEHVCGLPGARGIRCPPCVRMNGARVPRGVGNELRLRLPRADGASELTGSTRRPDSVGTTRNGTSTRSTCSRRTSGRFFELK